MINVGIVGYGFAGRRFHAYLISLTEGLHLYAVATRDARRQQQAREEYGCKVVATLDDLLGDDDVQLIVLATPHATHRDLAIQAMNAGKHVVTDKVMCLNAAEADAMIAARDNNGVMLSVFHNRRWDWDYLTVRQVIEQGLLGQPYLFEQAVTNYRRPGGWRAEAAQSGGILYDWGAHLVDQTLQLVTAPVTDVWCSIKYGGWGVDIGNYAKLVLRFADGTAAEINTGNLVRKSKPRWYVVGDRGTLVKEGLDPQEPAMLAGNIDAAQENPAHRARVYTEFGGIAGEVVVDTVHGSWTSYYRNIADVLNNGAELAVTAESVRRAMLVFDAAMESARTGSSVGMTG
ncbi:MAG TPA: Gfo/Idh/MocA family oxidoreductase [Chloroflexota bacterium]|nr:Gfo/Idh/MocA family oxidoreductase [Chloroflexota bacterium]